MPANHCIPHTTEARAKMSASRRGKPNVAKRRKVIVVDGVECFECSKCHAVLPRDRFYKSTRQIAGISSECKPCHIETSRATRTPAIAQEIKRASEMNRRAKAAGCIGRVSRVSLLAVFAECDGTCLKCGSTVDIEFDHVVPISKGGDNAIHNLQCLCSSCNDRKHSKTIDYRTPRQRESLAVVSLKTLEGARQ
jgi:5-methylcytosine-specific restriction endonuclease McrA